MNSTTFVPVVRTVLLSKEKKNEYYKDDSEKKRFELWVSMMFALSINPGTDLHLGYKVNAIKYVTG